MVIWITGLSGAGKTTFAVGLKTILRERSSQIISLDGDQLRKILQSSGTENYTRLKRLSLAKSYSALAKALSEQGFIVIISTISLFKEVHTWNRKNLTPYIEIFLNSPMETLRKRDQKGLYSTSSKTNLINVAGLDCKIDFPKNSEFMFTEFTKIDIKRVAKYIVNNSRGMLNEDNLGLH
jgi:adenylylsulfate kinase-like enzyme